MAPAPVEEIDFPALSDKILDVLRALWTLVCNLCIALWSYVSQAFWDVWTYPPFEAFRNEFVAALIALMDYVVAHPVAATAIAVLTFVVIPAVLNTLHQLFLHCLGFRRQSILRGSGYAANYQSTSYGGNVRGSSTFVRFQSQGTKGRYCVVDGTGSSTRN